MCAWVCMREHVTRCIGVNARRGGARDVESWLTTIGAG